MSSLNFRERQRQVRKDAILDAAHDLLVEQGYMEMSMDDLAARVGVSKATLYQHFPSKEDLVIHVIVRSMRQGEERILSQSPATPAIVRLERCLQQDLERRANLWSAQPQAMPIGVTKHPLFQEQHQRLVAALSALVEAAKVEGDIRPELPTPLIVRVVLTLFRSGQGDTAAWGDLGPAEFSRLVVSLIFNGICTSPHAMTPATTSNN